MLTIIVKGDEFFDEIIQEFVTKDDVVLDLEHSLVSLSKWESIFEKPFLVPGDKSEDEIFAYLKCMILTKDYSESTLERLSEENTLEIKKYVEAKQSATWFNEKQPPKQSQEAITSELIYYWMSSYNIPFECETWHLNRLFTLLRICGLKNSEPKKMSPQEIMRRNRTFNEQRRAQLGTTG